MISVVRKRAQHHVNRRTLLTATTFVMRNGYNTIDVWILLSIVKSELRNRGDLLRFVTGAHARRHDQHVVACSDAAVRSPVTHKRCALADREIVGRSSVQIFRKLAHDRNIVSHVVVRNLFALPDSERGSDWLTKLKHKLARGNVPRRKTMTRRDLAEDLNHRLIWQQQLETSRRGFLDHGNVVVRIDNDRELAE